MRSNERRQLIVEAIGHDNWCDYGAECGDFFKCSVWDTADRVMGALDGKTSTTGCSCWGIA